MRGLPHPSLSSEFCFGPCGLNLGRSSGRLIATMQVIVVKVAHVAINVEVRRDALFSIFRETRAKVCLADQLYD